MRTPRAQQREDIWEKGLVPAAWQLLGLRLLFGSPTNPRSVSPGWGSGLISWVGPGLGGLRGSGQQGSSRHSRGPAALGRRLALLVGLAATWGGGAGAGRRAVFPLLGISGAQDPRSGQALGELDRGPGALSAGPGHGALRTRGGERAARHPCRPPAAGGSLSRGLERRSLARRRAAVVRGVRWRRARDAHFPAENRQLLLDGGRHRRAAGRAKHSAYTRRWGPRPAAHLALNYAGTFGASVSPPRREGWGLRYAFPTRVGGLQSSPTFRVMAGRMGGSSGWSGTQGPGGLFCSKMGPAVPAWLWVCAIDRAGFPAALASAEPGLPGPSSVSSIVA